MVDITQCEECGRVIPATEHGCAYCDRDREGQEERMYMPLAVRLLVMLFLGLVAVTLFFGAVTLFKEASRNPMAAATGGLRAVVAASVLASLVMRRPWGRWLPFVFIGLEVALGLFHWLGWMPPDVWKGNVVAPFWSLVFVFVFVRADVQSRFDKRAWDRSEVGNLVRMVERGNRE